MGAGEAVRQQLARLLTRRYFPTSSSSFLRVASGTVFGSVIRACLSADPHLHSRDCGMAATAFATTLQAFSAFFAQIGEDICHGDGVVLGDANSRNR